MVIYMLYPGRMKQKRKWRVVLKGISCEISSIHNCVFFISDVCLELQPSKISIA